MIYYAPFKRANIRMLINTLLIRGNSTPTHRHPLLGASIPMAISNGICVRHPPPQCWQELIIMSFVLLRIRCPLASLQPVQERVRLVTGRNGALASGEGMSLFGNIFRKQPFRNSTRNLRKVTERRKFHTISWPSLALKLPNKWIIRLPNTTPQRSSQGCLWV